jgi:hypothetical protein
MQERFRRRGMTGTTRVIGVAFLWCLTLLWTLRTAVAVFGVKEMPRPVGVIVDLSVVALGFLLIANLPRLRPLRAFAVPLIAFSIAVSVDFGLTVLTTGRYIGGPPFWIAPAVSTLGLASGIYGLVVLARFEQ